MSDIMTTWPERPLAIVVGLGGMGIAVAQRLGQHYHLLLADINPEQLHKAAETLQVDGCCVSSKVCDISKAESVSELAAEVGKLGGFRVLAHVVGLSPSMADWRTIMQVNLKGAYLMAQAMLPHASANTAAVFVSSLAGHTMPPSQDVLAVLDNPLSASLLDDLESAHGKALTTIESYAFSKFALIKMCEQLASDWGKQKARIVSVSPGLIATPMGIMEFKNQPQKYQLLDKTPLARQGGLHEICDAIEYLVSDKASFISGTNLLVDGGIKAALTHV